MKSVTINERQAGRRIDRIIKEAFPDLPSGALFKAFRKKDIKVNGVRVKEDHRISAGDRVEVYIVDNILEGAPQPRDCKLNEGFTVAYEDKNLLIANKEQGVPVHPDREQSNHTLIDLVQAYLAEKGEYAPEDPSAFPPSLCHRLDRNTGGLVMIAKNSESLKILLDKIKRKEIKKFYQCLVQGKMEKERDELRAYLDKDEKKSRVFIRDQRGGGRVEIITRYRVLAYEDGISKLEVELVTGRTHQIRAHLAHIGHPIVGDGKYGTNSFNRSAGVRYQALWAYKITFDFTDGGMLQYLKGRTFEVNPEFRRKGK